MHLLYTDEVNIDPASSDFFVYAGIAISGEHTINLSNTIDRLRRQYGYRPEDILKFNTRERPSHITPDIHREIKREVMIVAAEYGVKLFASFILHSVAISPDEARRNEISRICFHFDSYLRTINEYGLVLIDTFQDGRLSQILRERFLIGIRGLPHSDPYRLERVLGFHLSCIGSSHFCSLVDIVIGSLRYAINGRNNQDRLLVVKSLLQQLAPLCIIDGDSNKIDEKSLFFSPRTIRVSSYLECYRNLQRFLSECGLECAQEISSG